MSDATNKAIQLIKREMRRAPFPMFTVLAISITFALYGYGPRLGAMVRHNAGAIR